MESSTAEFLIAVDAFARTPINDKLVVIPEKPYRLYIKNKLVKGNPFKPRSGCGPKHTPPLY